MTNGNNQRAGTQGGAGMKERTEPSFAKMLETKTMANKIDINQEYETRDGRPVRLYATDAGGTYTVHGAVWDEDMEAWEMESWDEFGAVSAVNGGSHIDLVPARKIRDLTMADLVEIVPAWARVSADNGLVRVENRDGSEWVGILMDASHNRLREVFEGKLLQSE